MKLERMTTHAMTALQQQAWQAPWVSDEGLQAPAINQPKPGWAVGLSLNK